MNKKTIAMLSLCVGLAVMAVAYAAFGTTINVNGTVDAVGDFAVTFLTGGTCTGTGAGAETPSAKVVTTAGTTTATFNGSDFHLYTPGDEIVCTIPIKNTGDLKAKLGATPYTISSGLNASSTPIAISVTDVTDELAANGTGEVKILFKYNWSGNEQPTVTTQDFSITVNYVQDVK